MSPIYEFLFRIAKEVVTYYVLETLSFGSQYFSQSEGIINVNASFHFHRNRRLVTDVTVFCMFCGHYDKAKLF